ncbi:MAG: phenylalanine--tRNA ligase subunit beta [Bacteroidia bacterium]|nr:phenylalanine--tRNA ligase subunit beta [Bacteroidia bacterium]
MRISYQWLKTLLSEVPSPEKTAEWLTGCGLEVESMDTYETVKGGLAGCVVGEVMTKEKHPDADKLSLTTVNVGSDTLLNIVCGAPNVAAGQKVIVALVGTTIYPGNGEPLTLKKAKIRGAVSEGMICAEDELGLGKSHAGIMILDPSAKPGTPAAEYFKLESDIVFEIGLTPNRADAASHWGVARDLAALTGSPLKFPDTQTPAPDKSLHISVRVEDPKACPRYSGITISNVKVGPSPDWLRHQLETIGVRSINNVVDATNYVLHELGQPLHAFDADKIVGKEVIVKKLPKGTPFTTLDGVQRKLDAEDLMICDAEKGMCIAGVFGGQHSGVTEQTKNIFLESAWFDAVHIRRSSKRHGLKTDASFRFERGTDPDITVNALLRAARLILETGGGKLSSGIVDVYPEPAKPFSVHFSYARCARLIGKDIGKEKIKSILKLLNITIAAEAGDVLQLEVPPYKVDVRRECDVVEEVLRIYGYNNVEDPQTLRTSVNPGDRPDKESLQVKIAEHLSSCGFMEIFCNSLSRNEYLEGLTSIKPEYNVNILNPLSSELNVLRQNLLFTGLEAISYNRNRKNADLRFFELGKVYARYKPEVALSSFHEEEHLAVFLTGNNHAASWHSPQRKSDLYILKNEILQLLKRLRITTSLKEMEGSDLYAYGLELRSGKQPIGHLGSVASKHLKKFDISEPVFSAELNWTLIFQLLRGNSEVVFHEVPVYPEVQRDLALLLDRKVKYAELEKLAFDTEKILLKEVHLFDVFEGEKIGKDKKSYALRFVLQDEKATLTDKQVEKTMERLVNAYKEKLGADIRS